MTVEDLSNSIDLWTKWANESKEPRYDIALLKIWIRLECFLSELFVLYATGGKSEQGYCPDRLLTFVDDTQLNAFLRNSNSKHIDYLTCIETLSKHIFATNPFEILFMDVKYSEPYRQVFYLRNYIAHESIEAKEKVIRYVFYDNRSKYVEPNDYLKAKRKGTQESNYSHFINSFKDIANLLTSGTS